MINEIRIRSIQIGKAIPFGTGRHLSAIDKRSVSGPIFVSKTGFKGDEQGDTRHHGGEEMAIHHYPLDHYDAWLNEYPELAESLAEPGAFGENISTLGMTEETVCIGDVYRVGKAVLQVSQGRQPCWKLNKRFGLPDMARLLQKTGRSGWYYRVFEPGFIATEDELCLEERPNPDWPLRQILHILYVDRLNTDALKKIVNLNELSDSWRQIAARRLKTHVVEDWTSRLSVPD
ncbi:MAG: MOSC domain-containing protein [Proteobacteria bacterium]|nr:MOSC domain-containing protein [Pseudomonadota bacterium]